MISNNLQDLTLLECRMVHGGDAVHHALGFIYEAGKILFLRSCDLSSEAAAKKIVIGAAAYFKITNTAMDYAIENCMDTNCD